LTAAAVVLTADATPVSAPALTFHQLHTQYAADVYRFAYWLSGNPHDARDITSETFVRVWSGTAELRMESVKAYLFAIARNLHRQQWRRDSRHVALEEAAINLPDPAVGPDARAAAREELQRTFAALAQLPEIDRTVLLMRAQAGLSHAEIAAATGLSEVAVKVKVFRARAKLAALLSSESEIFP
jgi:RNA polymerase sigma-70 factor (ECF subfamily)